MRQSLMFAAGITDGIRIYHYTPYPWSDLREPPYLFAGPRSPPRTSTHPLSLSRSLLLLPSDPHTQYCPTFNFLSQEKNQSRNLRDFTTFECGFYLFTFSFYRITHVFAVYISFSAFILLSLVIVVIGRLLRE
ncbi:hypothetical protein L1887_22150 [Cichorium endivia]|nr:hypothetical protein L1887_22150 [Cichorium endivia]